MKKPLATCLIVGLFGLVFFAVRAYVAQRAIEAELAKATRVSKEIEAMRIRSNETTATPDDLEQQIKLLESANRERHLLRNEVRQLRERTKPIDQLRQQNQDLRESLEQSQSHDQLNANALDFIPRSQWQDLGMHSPERAVSTFFYYLSRGDLEAFIARCELEDNKNPLDGLTPERREETIQQIKALIDTVPAYRISNLEQESDTEVTVQIQTALNGEAISFKLEKIGFEWKLDAEGNSLF